MEFKIDSHQEEYLNSINFMENRVNEIIKGLSNDLIWFVNYPSIYTFGPQTIESDLKIKDLFPVYETSRGGKLTYHGPGQRTVYLMIDLNKRTKDIKKFVRKIELVILKTLSFYNIEGELNNDHHGVFVQKNMKAHKIASIGLKFKKWTSFHGFSINVRTQLDNYKGIKPCGLNSSDVTSLLDLGIDIDLKEFDDILLGVLKEEFEEKC